MTIGQVAFPCMCCSRRSVYASLKLKIVSASRHIIGMQVIIILLFLIQYKRWILVPEPVDVAPPSLARLIDQDRTSRVKGGSSTEAVEGRVAVLLYNVLEGMFFQ